MLLSKTSYTSAGLAQEPVLDEPTILTIARLAAQSPPKQRRKVALREFLQYCQVQSSGIYRHPHRRMHAHVEQGADIFECGDAPGGCQFQRRRGSQTAEPI